MYDWKFEHNAVPSVLTQAQQERAQFRNVVDDVVAHHDIGFRRPIGRFRPVAQHLFVDKTALSGGSCELLQHLGLVVDSNDETSSVCQSQRGSASTTAHIQNASALR